MHSSSSSSSSSSSDNDYEAMFSLVKEWYKSTDERRKNEEAVVRSFIPLISSTIERPLPEARRRYVHREREEGDNILYKQYFAEHLSYSEEMFRCRYRMRHNVFCRIMEALRASDDYFNQKVDASGRLGLSIEQKCTTAMRILAYGTANDSVDRSAVFTDILQGHAPPVNYIVNNHSYNMGYYLTNGIYPKWAAFIQSISAPQTAKNKLFAKKQESVRKDVERAFRVLQARFDIVRKSALAWSRSFLGKIMLACIIIHNTIVEDERSTYTHFDPRDYEENSSQNQASTSNGNENFTFSNVREYDLSSYMSNRSQVRDTNINKSLKKYLIENIWEKFNEEFDDN